MSREAWSSDAGLDDLRAQPFEVATVFRDFDDYWTPFLGGQGPDPGARATLSPEVSDRLRARLQASLPAEPDGTSG